MMPRIDAIDAPPPQRVLGVLAGRDYPRPLLRKWASSADVVLAADAGLDRLLEAESEPDVVVGDMDSSHRYKEFPEMLHRDNSQDRTDTDKLLTLADTRGFRHITLICIEGDLLDHVLATLHSSLKSPLWVRIALRTGIGWLMKGGDERRVRTSPGRRISMIPLEEVRGATLSGVQWPLADAELHPTGGTSISNRAVDPIVVAATEAGSAFLFVEYPESEMPIW